MIIDDCHTYTKRELAITYLLTQAKNIIQIGAAALKWYTRKHIRQYIFLFIYTYS